LGFSRKGPKRNDGSGGFAVVEADASKALQQAKGMLERGLVDVQISDEEGNTYSADEFEQLQNGQTA
jgi:hypothetical protein